MLSAFLLSLVAVVLAEMGDKTQLLAMAFASKFRWQTVIWAVVVATLLNHLLAVALGNVVTQFLPMAWIKLAAAISFLVFGLWTIHGDKLHGEDKESGRSPFWTVAIAFFIAEMGDKTQLMTMAIAADEAIKIGGSGLLAKLQQTIPVWMGSTCGMIIADAVGIIVGIVMHKHIPEKLVKWIAALVFVIFGLTGLHEALKILCESCVGFRMTVLIAIVPALSLAMWFVARMSDNEREGEA